MSRQRLATIRPAMDEPESARKRDYINRIGELRLRRGMTQEEVAKALGIPTERYKKYESRSIMPVYLIERFAAIVGSNINFVVTGRHDSRRRGPKLPNSL